MAWLHTLPTAPLDIETYTVIDLKSIFIKMRIGRNQKIKGDDF